MPHTSRPLDTPQNVQDGARILVQAKYVTALIGAGLSAESGIPTFRGPGGLWTKLGEPGPASYQTFVRDPAAWWREQFRAETLTEGPRAEFRVAIERAQPNPGHHALAELEALGVLRYTITQNVDNLHFAAGNRAVAEIHGNRTKVRCVQCNLRWARDQFLVYQDELPPRCPECGGIIKGDGVMFGEPIPPDVLAVCFQQAALSDCMLLVGTSGTVYPAASLPDSVKDRGGALIEVNPFDTSLSHLCDVVLRGPSGDLLPRLVAEVRRLLRARDK